jgi:hypothetical protein
VNWSTALVSARVPVKRMARLDFWELQRSVQERFVASTEGAALPAPLAVRPLGYDRRQIAWLGLGALGFVGAIIALRVGFGDLSSRYALTPPRFCALYAGCFALSALGFFKAAARSEIAHAVPYQPALYLFPIGVIDARSPHFYVHRISEHTEVLADPAKGCLRVTFEGESFEFPTADAAQAEHAARAIREFQGRLAEAGPDSSARAQSLVDPLLDNGFKNPFSPTESLRKALPWWAKAWPLLALILGVLLGAAAYRIRNKLSEGRLYVAARAADDTATYRAYLARGGSNPDVEALLLPRAQLRDAVQRGGVTAIEQFRDAHPNTKIKPEVDAALEQALLKELAAAQAVGTLSALKDFGARYARYPSLAAALDRAIDARIDATLTQLKPTLASNESKLLPFIERLLHFTAKHGPEVLVRFRMKPTETLEKAEKALRHSAYFSGDKSLPGQYFDAEHEAPREATVAAALVAALSAHFPPDLVNAKADPALDTTAEVKPSVPTLLVTYHTEMSGAFTRRNPRLALSGIGLITRTAFEIPDETGPLTFKLSVWRAPDLKSATLTTTPEELYDAMSNEAFRRFTKKYLATLFTER